MSDADKTEEQMVRARRDAQRRAERQSALPGCIVSAVAVALLLFAGFWWFMSTWSFSHGRPLRGRIRKGRFEWRFRGPSPSSQAPRAAAAAEWRERAGEEYESIATFSELALDLIAAGAPPDLVTRCHRAALDEARHAQLCLTVATSLDGNDVAPSPFRALASPRLRPRWRLALLVRLAVESHLDGALGETGAAEAIEHEAQATTDARLRNALSRLAREERVHAKLGEDIVHWCNREGGALIVEAVRLAASFQSAPRRTSLRG